MKVFFTVTFLALHIFYSFGQLSSTEFEGRIFYTNSFKIKQPGIDSSELIKSFGASSIYSYKAGHFIWKSQGSQLQYEIYNSFSGLLVDKYESSDTLYKIDIFNKGDSMLSYQIVENADTICGYNCNAIKVVLQSMADNSIMKRTIFYSPKLFINPDYFKYYKSYANDKIYSLTKAIPLRIITEYDGLPVAIAINAIRIEQTSIDYKEFQYDKSLFLK